MRDNETYRADADYELRRTDETSTWVLRDKRTNHRWMFHDAIFHGYQNNVFLRHLPPEHRGDGDRNPSSGHRSAIIDKSALPDWLLDDLEHIDKNGEATPATDPRDNGE